jgi:hypothetical protein
LRARDQDLRELREELYRTRAYKEALERQLIGLRPCAPAGATAVETAQGLAVRSVVLGRQTGGCNHDDQAGDEALQVVVEPRDADGHAIKSPGSLMVRVSEITPEGLKKSLCSWQVAGEPLRRAWRSGLWNTGYFVTLPWKAWPAVERLRVVVQFILDDGRVFEAERDVTVRLAPAALRKVPPASKDEGPEQLLPPPRKLESPEGKPGDPEQGSLEQSPLTPAVHLLRPVPLRH